MCYGCWAEMGYPTSTSEAVAHAADLMRVALDYPVGGNFHIVVEDWNVEDDHIEYCRQQVAQKLDGTYDWSWLRPWMGDRFNIDPAQLLHETKMGAALAALSEADRGAALAMAEGWRVDDTDEVDRTEA